MANLAFQTLPNGVDARALAWLRSVLLALWYKQLGSRSGSESKVKVKGQGYGFFVVPTLTLTLTLTTLTLSLTTLTLTPNNPNHQDGM